MTAKILDLQEYREKREREARERCDCDACRQGFLMHNYAPKLTAPDAEDAARAAESIAVDPDGVLYVDADGMLCYRPGVSLRETLDLPDDWIGYVE